MQRAIRFCTLVEMLRSRALNEGTKPAYTFVGKNSGDEASITYSELEQQVRTVATLLRSLNMEGERVLLLYPAATRHFIAAFFGCLYARAIAVPVYPPNLRGHSSQEISALRHVAVDAGAKLLLTTSTLLTQLDRCSSPDGPLPVQCIATDDLPIADDHGGGFTRSTITGTDIAYLQYTSGSTGTPKGVIISHENVLYNVEYIDHGFRHDRDSVAVSWLPHFHDMGLVYGVIQPVYNGFRCVLMPPRTFVQEPVRWLDAISRYRATHSGGPNFSYDLCVRRVTLEQRENLDLSNWRTAFNGAEPVREQTLRSFAAAFSPCGFRLNAFYPAYGLAEATLKVTGGTPDSGPVFLHCDHELLQHNRAVEVSKSAANPRTLIGVGSASLHTKVMIMKPQSLIPVRDCEVGEVCVSGPGVAQGYWRRSDITKEVFQAADSSQSTPAPILRTGDLGFLRGGELFITGRLKDIIVVRGANYDPADIELTAEQSHPALRPGGCAVFNITSRDEEKLVVAHEVERSSRSADTSEVCGAVRSAIAERHGLHVHTVVLLKSGGVPKTSSGKVRRQKCRQAFIEGTLSPIFTSTAGDYETGTFNAHRQENHGLLSAQDLGVASGDVSCYLQTEMARILGARPYEWKPDLPLLNFGLDSLMVAELRNRIASKFNIDVGFADFFKGITLEQLIDRICQDLVAAPSAPAQRRTDSFQVSSGVSEQWLQPSPEQERFWTLDRINPHNPVYNVVAAIELTGDLDWATLRESICEVMKRQECLRSSFHDDGGKAVQQISPAVTFTLPLIDIEGLPATARQHIACDLAGQLGSMPFDLDIPPLIRFVLLRLGHGTHMLAIAAHHIIFDFASVAVLAKELVTTYDGLSSGKSACLLPPVVPYREVLQWQINRANSANVEQQLQYWQTQLADAVPLDLARLGHEEQRTGISFLGSHSEFDFPDNLVQSLQDVGRVEGVTLFVTLLTALKVTLCLLSQQEDITVGVPFHGRTRLGTESLVGLFAHPVLARTILASTSSLRELLKAVNDTVIGGHEHQDVPFAKVIRAANPRRSKRNTPLLSIMFRVIKLPRFQCTNLHAKVREIYTDYTDCDLALTVCDEDDGRIRGVLSYRSDVLDSVFIGALRGCYLKVLGQYVSDPDIRLDQLRAGMADLPVLSRNTDRGKIVIAASFTADLLREPLAFWLEKLNMPWRIEVAPYNQVIRQLLDSSGVPQGNRNGINVVLLRFEDWERYQPAVEVSTRRDFLESMLREFVAAVKSSTVYCTAPLLICICPPSPTGIHGKESSVSDYLEAALTSELASVVGVHVISGTEITKRYPVASYYDAVGDKLGHVPFTPLYFTVLSTVLARKIYALQGERYKMIVLDCDETLWNGVCSNDEDISIDPSRRALQQFMLKQRDAGMLLALCSKNDERDVIDAFERHPEMPLRLEHIVARRINWQPKSKNIYSLAAELEISLEHIIFVDDDPAECAEVEMHCPELLVLKLPNNVAETERFLQNVWAFDHVRRTEEDQRRSSLYQQEVQRQQCRQEHLTLAEFIQSLNVEVTITELGPQHFARAAQLTRRTTQFNTTGVRRSELEIQQIAASTEHLCLVVNVQDRFGNYGLVGAIILAVLDNAVVVDTFLLSCRALGRGVENRMIARVGEIAEMKGLEHIEFPFRVTHRNRPALEFLNKIGEGYRREHPEGWLFRIPSARAASLDPCFGMELAPVPTPI